MRVIEVFTLILFFIVLTWPLIKAAAGQKDDYEDGSSD